MRANLAQCEMELNKPTVGHAAYVPPEPAAATRMTGESDGAARDRLRGLGNDAFGRCRYDEAIRCYSAAIATQRTNPVYWSNRSACRQAVGGWAQALSDARQKASPSAVEHVVTRPLAGLVA